MFLIPLITVMMSYSSYVSADDDDYYDDDDGYRYSQLRNLGVFFRPLCVHVLCFTERRMRVKEKKRHKNRLCRVSSGNHTYGELSAQRTEHRQDYPHERL